MFIFTLISVVKSCYSLKEICLKSVILYLWKILFRHRPPCLVVREVAEKLLNKKFVKQKEKKRWQKMDRNNGALAIHIYID